MASSQGAGPYNHSASHPVGGSQMRERAPSSLVPEKQLSKPGYQSKEDNTPCTSLPRYPRGTAFPANHVRLVSTQITDPGQIRQKRFAQPCG